MNKFTFQNYLDDECTYKEYTSQFKMNLEVGKVYLQESDSWAKKHYQIIFISDGVAFANCVYCDIVKKPTNEKNLFYVDDGFKYQDIRPNYRLRELIKG